MYDTIIIAYALIIMIIESTKYNKLNN